MIYDFVCLASLSFKSSWNYLQKYQVEMHVYVTTYDFQNSLCFLFLEMFIHGLQEDPPSTSWENKVTAEFNSSRYLFSTVNLNI